ncbi:MAG: hypothetical protein ACFB10_00135 [Salibacteraceae bacterium]
MLFIPQQACSIHKLQPDTLLQPSDTTGTWEFRNPGKRKVLKIPFGRRLRVETYSDEVWIGELVGKEGGHVFISEDGTQKRVLISDIRKVEVEVVDATSSRMFAQLVQVIGGTMIFTGLGVVGVAALFSFLSGPIITLTFFTGVGLIGAGAISILSGWQLMKNKKRFERD